MKLYILHEIYKDPSSEDYDEDMFNDSYDTIVGFWKNAKACYEKKEQLEKEQKELKDKYSFCNNCPIHKLTKRKFKNHCQEVYEYCDNYNIMFERNECWCSNIQCYSYKCEESYEIQIVETKD